MTKANGSASPLALPSLDDLRASRTDYEDVPVPQLGGKVLRLWGVSGAMRVLLMTEARGLVAETGGAEDVSDQSPEVIAKVLRFQQHVVAASLGYPRTEWDEVIAVLPADTIDEVLYPVAERLSALNPKARERAVKALGTTASVGSGTD